MRKILFVSLLAVIIGIGQLMAQDRILSGTIKDETGQPLPSVNVDQSWNQFGRHRFF
jgi:hypothetical protein